MHSGLAVLATNHNYNKDFEKAAFVSFVKAKVAFYIILYNGLIQKTTGGWQIGLLKGMKGVESCRRGRVRNCEIIMASFHLLQSQSCYQSCYNLTKKNKKTIVLMTMSLTI